MSTIDTHSAPHYHWGEHCDGWHLLQSSALSVIQERVPPGGREQRHHHSRATQFFYVLTGEAAIELNGVRHIVRAQQGLTVPAGEPHQFFNLSNDDVHFLVISQPSTAGDRINAPPQH